MNTGPLKTYAIQARKAFIQAVTDRAAQLGITKSSIAPVQASSGSDKGVVVIAGAPFPASVVHARELVVTAIARDGFRAVIEQVAYTWFNRLAALRYMEVHNYLDHGLRVLSDPNGGAVPEVVARLRDLDLPTLDKAKAIELAMAGNQDEALYRLILLAQCQHLGKSMPWLFDTRLHDGVDLLLPEHLLATDSLVRGLVNDIPEEDWKQGVEIIGWLYQFFISERKDEVIGSVVAPEDIPAATQLFTPNWIVQYLVQNSVGRLWMESYPTSTLRQHMPYYIEPAPQDPEVQVELDKLVVRDRTPESLTVFDPACGSGHILVEAFRLLFRIYLERGHREREIPRLIFANNLFGLDIDDRAAQLACMTLLFEARKHDARVFTNPPNLSVLAIQQSRDEDRFAIDGSLLPVKSEAKALINAFTQAKSLGSLQRLDGQILTALPKVRRAIPDHASQEQTIDYLVTDMLRPLVAQAELMSRRYDAVIANPPYLGGKGMTKELKEFAKEEYPRSKADAFAMFIERGFELANGCGFNAMVTMQSWMFLSSYEEMRQHLMSTSTISSMCHMTNGVMGIAFGTAATSIRKVAIKDYRSSFCYTTMDDISELGVPKQFPTHNERLKKSRQSDFARIPGMPIAYWVSDAIRNCYSDSDRLKAHGDTRQGMATSDNERFLRFWPEVSIDTIGFGRSSSEDSMAYGDHWIPYNKGGDFRKWYGNQDFVLNWRNSGESVIRLAADKYGSPTRTIKSMSEYFKPCISWSKVSSGSLALRYFPAGFIFDVAGCSIFFKNDRSRNFCLGLLNSKVAVSILEATSPTINYEAGHLADIPIRISAFELHDASNVDRLVSIHQEDWDLLETSWGFTSSPWILGDCARASESFSRIVKLQEAMIDEAIICEVANNEFFIQHYGLTGELKPEVGRDRITLQQIRLDESGNPDPRQEVVRLISFSIGCALGRYSLDRKGIVYANAGNLGFDPSKYVTFPADADGIIPLTDEAWFRDDATERFAEFVSKAWPADGLDENLAFVANALGTKTNESSRDTIRRYFSDDFYKDHCQTYKKRPIYWLFSSGKQRAFQCLVYLHRYNADTLGRMRADYVIPLQGKLQGRQAALNEEVARAGSTAQRKQAQKALDLIDKKIRELAVFDDQLRSYADKRIELDLDDGVKVNIRKFGSLIDLKPLGNLDSEE